MMLLALHSANVELMPSVPVASFTFCRPFAQAEEHTSHRKTKIAVITKSWKTNGLYLWRHVFHGEFHQGFTLTLTTERATLTNMGPKSESL